MERENHDLNSEKKLQFSSLNVFKKSTISETYQNLYILMKNQKVEEYKNLKELVLSSSPLPLFEQCLQLAVIDCLQLESEVVKIFLSQNDTQIKRILHCNWFFKSLPSEFCISNLFPYVSASLRCKIITKLSKYLESENESEKYFMFVRTNFGFQRADYLLPRCSSKFILNHFEENKPTFNYPAGVRIIVNISKRHPEVGIRILSHCFNLKNNYIRGKSKNILRYLAGNYCDLFVPFLKKYQTLIEDGTFGKKLTKSVDDLFLILEFDDRVKLLTIIVGVREGEILSLCAWTRSVSRLCDFLKLLEPRNRLEMIQATFKRIYNLNFTDYSNCWACELLELLPIEARLPFVRKLECNFTAEKNVFQKNMNDTFNINFPETFVHLYDFGAAFFKFKELLRRAPDPSRRRRILLYMVKHCSINSDIKGMQEVVDFVASHHRNDDSYVIYDFIQEVLEKFPWSAFSSSTLEKLDDLIRFCSLRGCKNLYLWKKLKEKQIYHLLESGCSAEALAQAENFFESIFVGNFSRMSFVEDFKCRHTKTLFIALCNAAVRWICENPSEQSRELVFSCVIQSYVEYSKIYSGSLILREVSGLKEMLSERLKTKFGDIGGEKWPLHVWERYGHDVLIAPLVPKCLLYILKIRSELIETHFEGFLNCLLQNYSKNYKSLFTFFLKTASFLEKTEDVKEKLLKEFKNGDSLIKRENALTLYSLMSTTAEFTEAVEEFIPKQERVESGSDSSFGRIQLVVPRLIGNVVPRSNSFDLIMKFFFGDFLKSVIPSLQTCCHHMRVDLVIPLLKECLNIVPNRVSYQKDIVRLIAELSNRDDRATFCAKAWREYEHYSIRSILFRFVSNLFFEQPTRKSFAVFEECILQSDPNIIQENLKLQDVPDDFLQDYVSALFRFSEQQAPAFRNAFQQSILSHFENEKISLLSTDFCQRIIRTNLFVPESALDVRNFACTYILTADMNVVDSRVRFVLNLANGEWKSFSNFLRTLIQRFWIDRSYRMAFTDAFGVFLCNWPHCPSGVLFEDKVLIAYHHIYQKVLRTETDPELVAIGFGKELKEFFSDVNNLRDLIVIYAEALNKVILNFETPNAILAIRELVAGPKDRSRAIMGLLALPEESFRLFQSEDVTFDNAMAKTKMAMNDLVRSFEDFRDEVIEIYLRRRIFH